MTHFVKWTSIEKFSDAAIQANRQGVQSLNFRSKVKLHGCFSADSIITLENGGVKKISEICVGDVVMSYNIENEKFEPEVVVNTISQELDKEWLRLSFDDGSTIECTEDHQFYTKNRGWVEAKDLEDTDVFVEI